jgi:two-component system, OmpR family, response regulator VicR
MNEPAKLLYVEDDLTLSFVTRDNLEMYGYAIDFCEDGEEAFRLFCSNHYDLCILDVMLPKMDGYELAEKIRKMNTDIPIIFLTAKSTKEDKIFGLRLGADDYITKPFSIEELVLKINIFLKRSGQFNHEPNANHALGRFVFDMGNYRLILDGQTRQLTHREAELLKYFYEHKNSILKRDDLLMKIWGDDHYLVSRSLDVFISRLRKYLKDDPSIHIENIHNVGFRLAIKTHNV